MLFPIAGKESRAVIARHSRGPSRGTFLTC